MLEREHRLTPMKTVTDAVDVFLDPESRVTGASLGWLALSRLGLRAVLSS